VSNDFETVFEFDDLESDQPDAEEPSTWQHAQDRPDAEIDALDWADQHSIVDDSLFDEDAPESAVSTIASALNVEP
jgi:hypothetical protein